jgi:hypothetical protein
MFHQRCHPRDLRGADVGRFLSHLAREHDVAASTQNQALAALTLLYDRVLLQPFKRIDGISAARPLCSPWVKCGRSWRSSSRQRGYASR